MKLISVCLFRDAVLGIAVFFFLISSSVFAQSDPPEQHPATTGTTMRFPMETPAYTAPHSEGLLGRFFPNLHGNEALHFDYVYTGGVFNNARGGERTKGSTTYNGLFEIGITADTEKFGLWKNGTFYMHSLFSQGRNPSRYVSDYQGVSVLAYETPAQVSEYWYEHRFFKDRLKIKGGKQDAGVDFFYLESTADFINSSATFVPTTGAPTAPDNAWGVAAYFDLTDSFCLKVGIYDAQANANKFWMSESGDVYSAYQIDYHYTLFKHLPGFAYLGAWYDSSETESLAESLKEGRTHWGNYGFSLGFEQMVYRRHTCDDGDRRGLTMYVQYSKTKKDRNELKGFWALGFNWLGLLENRPDDIFGFAVNSARFSRGFRDTENLCYGSEYAYEIFYKIQMTDNIAVQPVFQYVVHPGGEYRNAFVPGLVFQVVF